MKEGSFWQDFGVKEGDIILDVDGHRLFDLPRSYFDEAVQGTNHSFTIVRMGTHYSLKQELLQLVERYDNNMIVRISARTASVDAKFLRGTS